MRHRDPHDDPPAKGRKPYRGTPVTLGHMRSQGVRHLLIYCSEGLYCQRGCRDRSLAGRYRSARLVPSSGLLPMRDHRRRRAAELARTIAAGEFDRGAVALTYVWKPRRTHRALARVSQPKTQNTGIGPIAMSHCVLGFTWVRNSMSL
jgi:hypothetical protein